MKIRLATLTGMILLAAATRLIPHPPNFAPIMAIALFGGAQFADRKQAFLVPLLAMLLSDAVIGFHSQMGLVYLAFAVIVLIGQGLRNNRSAGRVAGTAFACSLLFFAVTNLGVWAFQAMYPKTVAGLAACYVAALPFLQNSLAGDALYTLFLFGGFALAERWIPMLKEPVPAAAR